MTDLTDLTAGTNHLQLPEELNWRIRMSCRRHFLISAASAGALLSIGVPALAQSSGGHAKGATAITQVFGDGLRLIAVAVEYDTPIKSAELSAASFQVMGRTVNRVFTSKSADPAERAASGRFVIIALSADDAGASLVEQPPQNNTDKSRDRRAGPGPMGGGNGGPMGGPPPGMMGGQGPMGGPPPGAMERPDADADRSAQNGPPGGSPNKTFRPARANAIQTAALTTADGRTIPAQDALLSTTAVKNLIVDDFRQLEFRDPRTGDTLQYNLFVPKDYDPRKSYPLVLFMHDAGSTSKLVRTTLLQGLGAISWASPADQSQRPCFVLAPQYAAAIADDNSETTSMLDTTIDLVRALSKQYSIDRKRLYATGQSGGCMMAIAMNIKYPDFFAASFLVAGQWDAALVAPLARKKLWILVAQDDTKAFPGQNAITAALEQNGARISRAVWDGYWMQDQFQSAFDKLQAEGNLINYVSLRKGTVIAPGQSASGGAGHMNTWRIAYTIAPIREWIFKQTL
jgi:predicted peptidase